MHFHTRPIFTAAKKFGKVMFSQASVSHSVRGGGGWLVHHLHEMKRVWLASGQYASYWNAFLLC